MQQDYDVAIIGAGPGGYVCAIRCSQLGFRTIIINMNESLGGTCLNTGCIPTKTLLEASASFYNAKKSFGPMGINLENLTVDYPKMLGRKNNVVKQNSKGVQALMKKYNIDVMIGKAAFQGDKELEVIDSNNHKTKIFSKAFVIATGAKTSTLPFIQIDHSRIMTSSDILSLDTVPPSLSIIGAGVIGLEMGTHFARLGTKVDVFDIADSILPNFDRELAKELTRSLKKLGIKLNLSFNVESIENKDSQVILTGKDSKGTPQSTTSDYCLMSIGRTPRTKELGLENTEVQLDRMGAIQVDESLRTNSKNIFAIGDAIGGMMLAHKASEEGVAVAEILAGHPAKINYQAIPSVVYTAPEAASVGKTEEQLVESGIAYKTGVCQNRALGRAHAAGKLDGFAKVLATQSDNTILGVHLVAPYASEMIGEAVVALENKMTLQQLANVSHGHPTYLEALKEACLLAKEGKAIHC